MADLTRYDAEQILWSLTGGQRPANGNTLIWDEATGFRFGSQAIFDDPIEVIDIPASDTVEIDWANIINTPTTLADYGITDAYTKTESDARFAPISHTHHLTDVLDFGATGGLIQSDGSKWVRVDNISYGNLPTGGGTWVNGGDLTLTGGNLFLPASGLVAGHTTGVLLGNATTGIGPRIQVHGTDASSSSLGGVRWGNDVNLPRWFLGKSRNTTVGGTGAAGAVISGDGLGSISWVGDDGTDLLTEGARINVNVEGAVSGNRIPAVITIATATGLADNAITGKFSVGPDGAIGMLSGQRFYLDGIARTGDTYLTESSANVFNLTVGGATAFQSTASLNTMPVSALAVGHTANSFTISGGSFTAKAYVRSDNVGSHWGWLNEMQTDTASRVGVFGFLRSRAAGAVSVNGDRIMQISAAGHDGTDYHESASIRAAISGVVASNVVPTDLFFMVGNASGTLTERLRILSSGDLAVTAVAKIFLDGVNGTGNSYLTETSSDVVELVIGGTTLFSGSSSTATFRQAAISGALVLTAETFTTSTSSFSEVISIIRRSTGDMVDGFGTAIEFAIQDNAGVRNPIGQFGAVRAGSADNTGHLRLRTYTAGVVGSHLAVGSPGVGMVATEKMYWDGLTMVGDSFTYESAANIVDHYAGNVNILRLDGSTSLSDGDTNILVNRKAAGSEAQQRVKWKDYASLVAGDKVMILAA